MRSAVLLELKGCSNIPAFRPYIWSLVVQTSLGGWVSNGVDGVQLMLEGDDLDITLFLRSLPDKLIRQFPVHTIRLLKRDPLPESRAQKPFRLVGPVFYDGTVLPDRAPCPDCRKKMLDKDSPFFRYPFTSCPECGPRYSVTLMAGGKRENTTFRAFPPCEGCTSSAESGNPLQVCRMCGPTVFLIRGTGEPVTAKDPLVAAGAALSAGKIVAVKNFDGFVILCDPFHPGAVRKLRERKLPHEKPVSVFMNRMETVRKYFTCSDQEEALLTSPASPVVLMHLRENAVEDPALFCPDFPGTAGVAFPPTGLIHLLMESCPDRKGGFIPFEMLAFSGGPVPVNPADAGGDDDLAEVSRIADLIVMHDLKIWHSSGPSVQAVSPDGKLLTYRRSSGLCPEPVLLRKPLKRTILALGSDSCAAVSIGFKNRIYLSHQMGNIRSERNSRAISLAAEHLAMMFARIPEMIVCDMDHSTFSAGMGVQLSEKYRIPLTTVQRHHANALACLAEHQLPRALALVWDGGSGGLDGTIWGAELLEVSPGGFRRFATFSPVPMNKPRERTLRPAFLLTRYLDQAGVALTEELAELLGIPFQTYQDWRVSELHSQTTDTHAALTLFDAVSAAIGIAPLEKTYDHQGILRLEHVLANGFDPVAAEKLKKAFPFQENRLDILMIDWIPFFRNADFFFHLRKENPGTVAAAFLMSVADSALQMIRFGAEQSAIRDVVLSGKAFLSPSLTSFVSEKLNAAGFRVYRHEITSPDESSVSIGQAVFGGMA